MSDKVFFQKHFKGAIPLLRKFRDHPFWREKRVFSKAEAWIDLIYDTRYGKKPETIIDRGEYLVINRGEILTSMLRLSEKWKWSEGKVKKFLLFLEKNRSISIRITKSRRTIINMLTYCSILDNLSNYENGKMRTEFSTEQEQNENKLRDKNKSNNDNKEDTTFVPNNKIENIIRWAYERARIPPSCSKESFRIALLKAISQRGYENIYRLFSQETNAINFLHNIKHL